MAVREKAHEWGVMALGFQLEIWFNILLFSKYSLFRSGETVVYVH